MDDDDVARLGRQLTEEEYGDLEATVRRHHEYLERIVEILREQEKEISYLKGTRRRQWPGG